MSTASNPSQHNPDPPTSQNQPRQKIKKISATFKELAIVREISIAMPLIKMLKKRTQEKVGSNQSPRVEIDRAATLTCIVAIKKHSKSLNLIQTYHNSTTQNQQLFSRSGATNTHQIQQSTQRVLQRGERKKERERERERERDLHTSSFHLLLMEKILFTLFFFFGKNSAHLGQLKKPWSTPPSDNVSSMILFFLHFFIFVTSKHPKIFIVFFSCRNNNLY